MQFLSLFAAATSVSALTISSFNLDTIEKIFGFSKPIALTEEEIAKAEEVFDKFADLSTKERVGVLNSFGDSNIASGSVIGGVSGVATGGIIGGVIGAHIGRKNAEKNAAGSLPKAT